jgi:hypothetical protein
LGLSTLVGGSLKFVDMTKKEPLSHGKGDKGRLIT